MQRILITGIGGQVGAALIQQIQAFYGVDDLVKAVERSSFNLTDADGMLALLDDFLPTIIINPAAYTAVDLAESEQDLATTINAQAPAVLADWAKQHDALLLHYSTDYVFNGQKTTAYQEDDPTDPQNVYGQSKLDGERAIVASGCRHLIFRTSWVYSAHGKNFVKTILRLAAERDQLSIVADQQGAPTAADVIAGVSLEVLQQYGQMSCEQQQRVHGIYHLTGAGATTWHAFAQYIVQQAQPYQTLRCSAENILPIPSSAYPTPAKRPANSCLDTRKLTETFDVVLPTWQSSVDQVITQLFHPALDEGYADAKRQKT